MKAFYVRLLVLLLASAVLTLPLPATDVDANYLNPSNLTDVINRYVAAQQNQQEAMRGAQMEVEIAARLPGLEKQGKLRVLRMISRFGQISFQQLGQFIGDPIVRKEVILKYLSLETEQRERGSLSITPQNYTFQIKAIITQKPQQTYIFELKPRRKAVGLFKGELWLDGATGMPLKETGQMVKSGSVWLKSIRFVRDYELRGDMSVLKHLESTVDVRLIGKAELSIAFGTPTWQENNRTATAEGP